MSYILQTQSNKTLTYTITSFISHIFDSSYDILTLVLPNLARQFLFLGVTVNSKFGGGIRPMHLIVNCRVRIKVFDKKKYQNSRNNVFAYLCLHVWPHAKFHHKSFFIVGKIHTNIMGLAQKKVKYLIDN